MVEGTGLENQRRKRPQVRILSFPPRLGRRTSKSRTRFFESCPFLFDFFIFMLK